MKRKNSKIRILAVSSHLSSSDGRLFVSKNTGDSFDFTIADLMYQKNQHCNTSLDDRTDLVGSEIIVDQRTR